MKITGKNKMLLIIGVVGLLGIVGYLLFFRKSGTANTTPGLVGSGNDLPKEQWELEDEALLNKYRNHPAVKETLGWVDPLWQERYNSPVSMLTDPETLNGNRLLSGTFYQVLARVAPNPNGKYSSVHWDKKQPSLYPQDMFDTYWREIHELKSKFFKLK